MSPSRWEKVRDLLIRLPRRQIKLFACDVLRILSSKEEKDRSLEQAAEIAELYVFGQDGKKQLKNKIEELHNVTVMKYVSAVWALRCVLSNNFRWSARCASNAVSWSNLNIKDLYEQARQSYNFTVTPTLQSIAHNIIQTRNFEEYYVLLDNLEEIHNIQLPRVVPLGLSHYVLYTLTNTN